jgi:hypothetical protein
MAGSTYLNLTNQLLRRLNEVEVVDVDFADVQGVQALAKDAILAALRYINQNEYEWPFNAANTNQVLSVAVKEYSWIANFKVVDWNSFQLQKDDALGIGYSTLRYIERDEYYARYRDVDFESGATGGGVPLFVFPAHGAGFGVSPSPDKAYTVNYRFYLSSDFLVNHYDTTRIPTQYDSVIIDGALYHMYMFRDNNEAASITLNVFQQGIKNMQGLLINQYDHITDTRVLAPKRTSSVAFF